MTSLLKYDAMCIDMKSLLKYDAMCAMRNVVKVHMALHDKVQTLIKYVVIDTWHPYNMSLPHSIDMIT